MSIVLARIDSRLIHGQVLEAWVPHVRADSIVVVNDAAANTPLQRLIMQAAVPRDILLVICAVDAAPALLVSSELDGRRVLLLFADAADALRACRQKVGFDKLNLGNMHAADGKARYNCNIALDQGDIDRLNEIEATGIRVVVQSVPADREVSWQALLNCKEVPS